jgi:hypothetical protein
MSASPTLLNDQRNRRDALQSLGELAATKGISSDRAHQPNDARDDANNQTRSMAGKRFNFEPTLGPSEPSSNQFANDTPSLGRRICRALVRYCIVFMVGIGATLAWQSHGDEAKEMAVNLVPSLGWLLSVPTTRSFSVDGSRQPDAGRVVYASARDEAHATATSGSQSLAIGEPVTPQQLGRAMFELADMRRGIELLASKQEQLANDIATLQVVVQDTIQKAPSAASTRPLPIPARKPLPAAAPPSPEQLRPVQPSAVQSSSVFPPPPSAQAPLR